MEGADAKIVGMHLHTLDATFVLLLWSNLANHQISATVSTLSTTEHESQNTSNHQNQSSVLFVGGDTFEGENSLELLNDSYSSDELVTSSSEFSDNLKDILKVDNEEEEEGSTISSEDNFYYSEEGEEYNDGEIQLYNRFQRRFVYVILLYTFSGLP